MHLQAVSGKLFYSKGVGLRSFFNLQPLAISVQLVALSSRFFQLNVQPAGFLLCADQIQRTDQHGQQQNLAQTSHFKFPSSAEEESAVLKNNDPSVFT